MRPNNNGNRKITTAVTERRQYQCFCATFVRARCFLSAVSVSRLRSHTSKTQTASSPAPRSLAAFIPCLRAWPCGRVSSPNVESLRNPITSDAFVRSCRPTLTLLTSPPSIRGAVDNCVIRPPVSYLSIIHYFTDKNILDKTRKPLKLAGVPQTTASISAVSGPKFTILWSLLEDILLLNKFFPDCQYVL